MSQSEVQTFITPKIDVCTHTHRVAIISRIITLLKQLRKFYFSADKIRFELKIVFLGKVTS
jgi:hypothetical protein